MSKNKGGRPLKFQSPEELDKRIDAYFDEDDFPTITGLALYLDTSRETLREYSERPEFVDSIKRAVDRCEHFVNRGMLSGKLNVTGAIFNLKNNYGWKDKTEQDLTSNGDSISPVMVKFVSDEKPNND